MASDSPWAITAPVQTRIWARPASIISQSTRPILPTVMAPETVTTRVHSGSSAMARRTAKASPSSRPPKAVRAIRSSRSARRSAAADIQRFQRFEAVLAAVVQRSGHGLKAPCRRNCGARHTISYFRACRLSCQEGGGSYVRASRGVYPRGCVAPGIRRDKRRSARCDNPAARLGCRLAGPLTPR